MKHGIARRARLAAGMAMAAVALLSAVSASTRRAIISRSSDSGVRTASIRS